MVKPDAGQVEAALDSGVAGGREIKLATNPSGAVVVVATPGGTKMTKALVSSRLWILACELVAKTVLSKGSDVGAVLVLGADTAEGVACQEAGTVGDVAAPSGWAGCWVGEEFGAAAELADVAGCVFAAAALGAALVVDAQLEGRAVCPVVAAVQAGGAGGVAIGARQRTLRIALTASEFAGAVAATLGAVFAVALLTGGRAGITEAPVAVANLFDAILGHVLTDGTTLHAGACRRPSIDADVAEGAFDVAAAQMQAHAQCAAQKPIRTKDIATAGRRAVASSSAGDGYAAAVGALEAFGT